MSRRVPNSATPRIVHDSLSSGSAPSLSSVSTRGTTGASHPAMASGTVADDSDNSSSLPSSAAAQGATAEGRRHPGVFLPEMMDPVKLYKEFCAAQAQIDTLLQENTLLKARLLDSSITNTASSTSTDSKVSEAEEAMQEDIRKWGRSFSLFSLMFVTADAFKIKPGAHFSSSDPERFLPENQDIGTTLELYEYIPKKYHKLMLLSTRQKGRVNFTAIFCQAVSSSRSSTLMALRQNIAPLAFSLPARYFITSRERSTITEIQALLGPTTIGRDGDTKYSRFPPCLSLDGDSARLLKRFSNDILFKLARGIIFGKSAVNDMTRAHSRKTSTYIRTDKRPETTFGLIAYVSIACRYILSDDERFESNGIGHKTKIDYIGDFTYYKRWLTEAGASSDRATSLYVKNLLHEWDNKIFTTQYSKAKGGTTAVEDDTETIDLDEDEFARDLDLLRLQSNHQAVSMSDPTDLGDHSSSEDSISGCERLGEDNPNYELAFSQSKHPWNQPGVEPTDSDGDSDANKVLVVPSDSGIPNTTSDDHSNNNLNHQSSDLYREVDRASLPNVPIAHDLPAPKERQTRRSACQVGTGNIQNNSDAAAGPTNVKTARPKPKPVTKQSNQGRGQGRGRGI